MNIDQTAVNLATVAITCFVLVKVFEFLISYTATDIQKVSAAVGLTPKITTKQLVLGLLFCALRVITYICGLGALVVQLHSMT